MDEPKRYDIQTFSSGIGCYEKHVYSPIGSIIDADDPALQRWRRIAQWAESNGLLDEHGEPRKIIGTLPVTADGCICGLPPGFGSLFGKGRNCPTDRYDPVSMRYDNDLRCAVLIANGLHGGREWDGIPIRNLYSTRESAESAARAAKGEA